MMTAQFLRYLVVGLASNAASFMAYLALTNLGLVPKLAMTLLYIPAVAVSYFGNRRWTFAHRQDAGLTRLKFIACYGAGYGLNILWLEILVDRLGYPHQWVQLAAIPVVAISLFLAFRYLVFTSGPDLSGEAQ